MPPIPFDADAVRALAAILAESGLTEIEIEGKEGRIRVARVAAAAPAAQVTVAAPAPTTAAAPAPLSAADEAHPGAVTSPMVGIVYLSPEPGAAPFVNLGQNVAAGQTLLLIEAMKTFNQIKAPRAGVVARILVTPGVPVEFGQPLLILD